MRNRRAPPTLIPNCKFIILLLGCLEKCRCLSVDEVAVRMLCQDTLTQAIRERAAYWKRCKQRAIKEGDANTRFFHAHATQRMRVC